MYNKGQFWREIISCGLEREIKPDVSMKCHTSWKIGGNADFFCIPSHQDQLKEVLSIALNCNLPIYIIGNGTNIWVPDEGIKGLVVKIARTIDKVEYSAKMVKAGAGILLPTLVREATDKELSGMEFAAHIPGTLGGAIINNASFGNESLSEIVNEISLFDYGMGCIKTLNKKRFSFQYRGIDLGCEKFVILGASLILSISDRENILLKINNVYEKRKARQPVNFLTAGCVFKNPGEKSAGYLIEKAGAKGLTIGDAQVSTKHANFIINRGQATASDILRLVEKIESIVEKSFGIRLEREIDFIGLPGYR
jgi:UDP-N-acetylmuramate dehydrogenase